MQIEDGCFQATEMPRDEPARAASSAVTETGDRYRGVTWFLDPENLAKRWQWLRRRCPWRESRG
jgi:hypothetical protein